MFRRDNYDPIEKPKRIKDPKALAAIWTDRCEICLRPFGDNLVMHRHHIRSRGAGGPDCRQNILCVCQFCHDDVHRGLINRERILMIKRAVANKPG